MVNLKLMTPKMVCLFILSTFIFMFSASAQTKSVLFLGVFNPKGEHVETPLEQALRLEFSSSSKFRIVNSKETVDFLRKLEPFGATPLERIVPPKVKTPDSTIVIWAVVKESSMRVGRRLFFWGKADASLTLDFFICELKSGEIYYRGELSAKATKGKNFLFVVSAQKNVHISAIDRSELKGKLRTDIVKSANDIFLIVLNSLSAGNNDTRDDYPADTLVIPEETDHRIPSVTDLFSEPAMDITEQSEESGAQPINEEQTDNQQSDGMEATVTAE